MERPKYYFSTSRNAVLRTDCSPAGYGRLVPVPQVIKSAAEGGARPKHEPEVAARLAR